MRKDTLPPGLVLTGPCRCALGAPPCTYLNGKPNVSVAVKIVWWHSSGSKSCSLRLAEDVTSCS